MVTIGSIKLMAILFAVWLAGYLGRTAQLILNGEWENEEDDEG